ncbi:C2 calcium-dependent domain-containing protein 4B [Monodelphis domestica]|uniref:C2 calcium-dependent domain-containing protein 4A-like n=1 Tax=Monodelphis domestica TaxID=13616 RepID=F6WZN2_MONDO|nr:C2 calcium-dependent domain-containing protein 4B [Monodelphis domestica]
MRFLEKLRDSTGVSTALEPEKVAVDLVSKRPAVSPFCNVLTPGRIPAFCIPPRLPSHTVPALQPLGSSTSPPRRCTVETDMWPHSRNSSGSTGEELLRSECVRAREDPDLTDWDPRSQAALSLPHLPRQPTSYGFCALLESPNTRRKESLFLGSSAAAAALLLQAPSQSLLRPRAHTYCGSGGTNASCNLRGRRVAPDSLAIGCSSSSSSSASSSPCRSPRPQEATAKRSRSRQRYRRLLRAPDALGRALRASGSRVLARARSVSSTEDDDEDYEAVGDARSISQTATCQSGSAQTRALSPSPSPSPLGPLQERLEVQSTLALGCDGGALHLATEYCSVSQRLRIRLLSAQGLYSCTAEPGAIGCRVSITLVLPGKTHKQRSAVVRRSRNPVFNEDFFFEGLSENDLRRTAVRVKAENKGRGLERDRLLGRGELELRTILL